LRVKEAAAKHYLAAIRRNGLKGHTVIQLGDNGVFTVEEGHLFLGPWCEREEATVWYWSRKVDQLTKEPAQSERKHIWLTEARGRRMDRMESSSFDDQSPEAL